MKISLSEDTGPQLYQLTFEELILVPFNEYRIIIIGDEAFLDRTRPFLERQFLTVQLIAKKEPGIALIPQSLRMGPDSLILSEDFYLRSEADARLAAATGHEVFVVVDS